MLAAPQTVDPSLCACFRLLYHCFFAAQQLGATAATVMSAAPAAKPSGTEDLDGVGRDLAVAVQATMTKAGVVCTCSSPESCQSMKACTMQEPMERALDKVRSTLGITMADLFEILGASLRTRAQALGRAVLYGASTCVVRMPGGSWPFAVVRKTRAARWIGFSCRTEDVSCHHSKAAAEAARRATQGKSESDSDSSSGGEDDVGIIDAGDTP